MMLTSPLTPSGNLPCCNQVTCLTSQRLQCIMQAQAVHDGSIIQHKHMCHLMRGTFMRAACLTASISAPAASTQLATPCGSCPTMLRSAWSALAFCCSKSWRASNSSAPAQRTMLAPPPGRCTVSPSKRPLPLLACWLDTASRQCCCCHSSIMGNLLMLELCAALVGTMIQGDWIIWHTCHSSQDGVD